MANASVGSVRLIDDDGDSLVNASGELKVSIGADVDIGNVEMLGHQDFHTYPQVTVGTSIVQLSTGISVISGTIKEMIIQADFDNASFIMVGDSGILASDVDGIRINAGDTLTLPFANTTEVYFRSDTADQKVNIALLY